MPWYVKSPSNLCPFLTRLKIDKVGARLPGRWYFRACKLDGSVVQDPQILTSWFRSATNGFLVPDKVTHFLRCSLCMRGAPFSNVAPHAAKDCGLIASLNKIRDNNGYAPMVLREGYLEASVKKKVITLEFLRERTEKVEKELRSTISALTKRVEALEVSGKKKRKGTPASTATPTPKAKKAKATSTGGKQSAGAKTSTPATAKTDGKKKAAAKGKAATRSGGGPGATIVEVSE